MTFGFRGRQKPYDVSGLALDALADLVGVPRQTYTPSQLMAPVRAKLVVGLWSGAKQGDLIKPSIAALPEQLFTVKQVAARLSVCTATVYTMIEQGQLASVRIRNFIRVPGFAVAEMLRGKVAGARVAAG